MTNRRKSARDASYRMAFCGMMAALSVALMLTAGLIPVMTYAVPLFCGLLLLPVRLTWGRGSAWLTWLTVVLITLLIGLDREAAFFYLFVGWYPIVKFDLDRKIRKKGLRLLVKAALFALCVCALYAFLGFVLHLDAMVAEFQEMGIWLTAGFIIGLMVCLLLFDYLITPLTILYVQRLEPKLKKMGR